MSLENIAAGLFNFNPVQGLQAGTSMGAQMMEIALQSQQQQLDAGAKWDQAALAADRNALSRRTQMFNEMTANLNRFDEQARQQKVDSWAAGVSGGGGGGGSSVNYADLPTQSYAESMPQTQDQGAPMDTTQYLQEPSQSFSSAPPIGQGVDPNLPTPAPEISWTVNSGPQPIGGNQPASISGGEQSSFSTSPSMPSYQNIVDSSKGVVNFSQAAPAQVNDTPSSPVKMGMGTPQRSQSGQSYGGERMPFSVDWRTRDAIRGNSAPGNRLVSLDYNSSNSGGNYAMIVIPDNATEAERAAAQGYLQKTTEWFRQNGVEVGEPVIKTTRENGRGVGGFFHTEPAFVQNKAAMSLLQEKGNEYADILSSTLGGIEGTTFIAPHKTNDPGASGNGFLGERDFARQFILPHLAERSGSGIRGDVSAYSPRRGASNVSGAGGEGGYAAAKPGPDGVAEVRTLDDFASGRSPYVTVAGNEALTGRKYTIPKIPFMDASGNTRTLENVPVVVHDTGSAFSNAPEGRFDIPIARDQGNSLMRKNHALWSKQGVSFIPTRESQGPTASLEPQQPNAIQTGPNAPSSQTFRLPERTAQPNQPISSAAPQQAQSQQVDYNQFPEYRAAQEARAAYQETVKEQTQNAVKLQSLREQGIQLAAEEVAAAEAMRASGARPTQAEYNSVMFPITRRKAMIESQIAMVENQQRMVLERQKPLEKSANNAEASWKIVQDRQATYQKVAPQTDAPIDREAMIDAYENAESESQRDKIRLRLAGDNPLIDIFDRMDERRVNQAGGGDKRTWKVGGDDYTLNDIVQFYKPINPNAMSEPDAVQKLVESNPKLKAEVMAAQGQSGIKVNVGNASSPSSGPIGISGSAPAGVTVEASDPVPTSKVEKLLKRGKFEPF